jgi:chromosome segregation ATPase
MPASIQLRRGSNDPHRDKLRQALAALSEQRQRLHKLEQGHERCHEQVCHAYAAQLNAEEHLRAHAPNEPQRLALAYLNNQVLDAGITLNDLEDQVARATAEHARLSQVEAALNSEIAESRRRMQDCHGQVHAALSELICSSPELAQLFAELDQAWAKLRGIRKAFDLITTALHGDMPTNLMNKWQISPPLDYNAIGFPLDESAANAWQAALQRLLADAEVPLPVSRLK